MNVKLTPADVDALAIVWDAAIANSCNCAGHDVSDGYLFHERQCYVHRQRKVIERVAKIIDRCRVKPLQGR